MTRRYAACTLSLALGLLSLTAVAAKEPDNVDLAIERGLEYLLAVQKETGAYPGQYGDTVAIPALAAMACLATGHVPGDAKYGKLIERSLDYVLANHDETGYFGKVGNGKTYMAKVALATFNRIHGGGIYVTQPVLQDEFRAGSDSVNPFKRYANAPMLVLDELSDRGNDWTEFVKTSVESILVERHRNNLPTVLIGNTDGQRLLAMFDIRIRDRLKEGLVMQMRGKSLRKEHGHGKED